MITDILLRSKTQNLGTPPPRLHQVNRLMKVSCGGLIGLSVVAVLIVALSVVVFFYPKKVNRVAPTLEESSAANLHRHVTNS
ncbi:hypothetical protein BaRGS_00004564 [Batillaria attramentaria]|uniref:Uncharacterized protein n=1 Tax=Batillaria attramentaria TaxID=370345 RepID=A0ABD0LX91_9CAEN